MLCLWIWRIPPIKDLRAEGVSVERSVILSNGFKCEGSVNLARATIGGYLMCAGGQFLSADGLFALDANNANIQGDVSCPHSLSPFQPERRIEPQRFFEGGQSHDLGLTKTGHS
jgi:hypothetical protein